jgi:hypothetical protein
MFLVRAFLLCFLAVLLVENVYGGCGDNGMTSDCTGRLKTKNDKDQKVAFDFPDTNSAEFNAEIFQQVVRFDHNALWAKTPMGCICFELTYCDCGKKDKHGAGIRSFCSKITLDDDRYCAGSGAVVRTSYKALYDAAVNCDNTYKATNGGKYSCLTNNCKTWRTQMRRQLGLPSSSGSQCPKGVSRTKLYKRLVQFQKKQMARLRHNRNHKHTYSKRNGREYPAGADEVDPTEVCSVKF